VVHRITLRTILFGEGKARHCSDAGSLIRLRQTSTAAHRLAQLSISKRRWLMCIGALGISGHRAGRVFSDPMKRGGTFWMACTVWEAAEIYDTSLTCLDFSIKDGSAMYRKLIQNRLISAKVVVS
jgi:hypothetical protein